MSWALRSLLSRPHLLLSGLRAGCPRGSHPTAVLGRSNLMGSRGYASSSNGDLHAEVKRHLYVVLDNYKDGYGIHKLDLAVADDHDSQDGGVARRLPHPPALRVPLATVGKRAQFARVGSSIVAIGTHQNSGFWADALDDTGVVLVFDTETAEIFVSHHIREALKEDGYEAAMAVGNRLYMLESTSEPAWTSYKWNGGGNVHCLTRHPGGGDGGGWSSWEQLSHYSPWSWSNDGGKPLTLPFWANYITAYAAHAPARHEHEIVVSVRGTYDMDDRLLDEGTFTFSTASREWTRRGGWQMPVHGHAHYDSGLDAWVGLHAVHDDGDMDGPRVTDGRLCVGQIITSAPREWKVGREVLIRLDEDFADGWRHLDAKLVPMAPREGGGEYCLIERLLPPKREKDGDGENDYFSGKYEWSAEEKESLLRLTAFRVERGRDGEPVATARRPARSYRVPRYNSYFDAQAFWM